MKPEMDSEVIRSLLIKAFRRDADLHKAGRFNDIGFEYADIDEKNLQDYRLIGALDFWNGWLDEIEAGFTERHETGIEKDMWPQLARYIADQLSEGKEIADPLLLKNFEFYKRPSLLSRIVNFLKR